MRRSAAAVNPLHWSHDLPIIPDRHDPCPPPPCQRLSGARRSQASRLRSAGMRRRGHVPRAQGARPAERVLLVLSRARAGLQRRLGLLPRHEPPRDRASGPERHRLAAPDPFEIFGEGAGPGPRPEHRFRDLPPEEQEALAILDLPPDVSLEDLKARYKVLVKRHHPDANGGDKQAEERVKAINHAYSVLKKRLAA